MKLVNSCVDIADRQTAYINSLEDKLAFEWYGCSYDELDEDERGEISMEVADRLS